jgi:hypothetical protein
VSNERSPFRSTALVQRAAPASARGQQTTYWPPSRLLPPRPFPLLTIPARSIVAFQNIPTEGSEHQLELGVLNHSVQVGPGPLDDLPTQLPAVVQCATP